MNSGATVTDRGLLIIFLAFVVVMTWRLPNPREFLAVVGLAFVAFLMLEQQYATSFLGSVTTDIGKLHDTFTGGTNGTAQQTKK